MSDCPFCAPLIEAEVVLSDAHCFSVWTGRAPVGSAMVLPHAHRETVFDLTEQEWHSTRQLLRQMRELIATQHSPDGWNVGWNVYSVGGQSVPHAHCHLIPRYAAEPLAGRGIRHWIKAPSNRPPRQ